MNKNLIIGIGGTGLSAIRELRRLIAERYREGLEDQAVAAARFLYIDTDENWISRYDWSVLGKDVSLKEREKVIISGERLQPIVDHPDDYLEISSWLPQIRNYLGEPGEGAKGIRPYGRLIYEFSANKEKIHRACSALHTELDGTFKEPGWRFYLVCGLSGGTGSGMFLPLAFDMLQDTKDHTRWQLYQRGTKQRFRAFLVLPPVQIVGRHSRYHANAYAALAELNYYAAEKKLPFSNCYLVEPQNADGNTVDLDSLPLLVAQRIFLSIQEGGAAGGVESPLDNDDDALKRMEGEDEIGRRHACPFSSFGLSAVSHPREIVAKCLAYRVASFALGSWLEKREDYPRNFNEIVMTELQGMRLSTQHVLGDADPFGKEDKADHTVEIRNLVDEKVQAISKKQLGENALQIKQSIEKSFRGQGISSFYSRRAADVVGACEQALIATREKVTTLLSDQGRGLEFAKRFVDELIKVLENLQQRTAGQAGEKQEELIKTWQENLTDAVSHIRANEQKLIYTDSRFHRDRTNLAETLTQYLCKLADYHSARYGVAFLGLVVPRIKELRTTLDVLESRLREAKGKLDGHQKAMLESLAKGSQENGKVIFDETSLEGLVSAAPKGAIQKGVEDSVQKLARQKKLDIIALGASEKPQDLVKAAAYDWISNESCPINISIDSLYDKFVAKYPDSGERQDLLKRARSLAAVFLKYAPEELEGAPLPASHPVTTVPRDPGKMVQGRTAHQVVEDDLVASGTPAKEIIRLDDPDRIIFLKEEQGFPLRFIESVRFLRAKYDSCDQAALHIDREIISRLDDLYNLRAEQRASISQAEEAFLFARTLGWLERKQNLHNHSQEVRFEVDGEMGLEKFVLARDWEEAGQAFVSGAISGKVTDDTLTRARKILIQRMRDTIRECSFNEAKRSEIMGAIKRFNKERSDEYAAHEDDPRYKRDFAIFNRIQKAIGSLTVSA